MPPKLLTRDAFREGVFQRDGFRCVLCGDTGSKHDAHHIIERRLWPDGGYYLDNGVTVCEPCHLRCEQTLVSCEDARAAAGIQSVLLPPHLYATSRYDKWGNVIVSETQRTRGELFADASVRRVLAPVLDVFTDRVKYPRTHHLPWSPGVTSDDRVMPDTTAFQGEDVVVTVKMDGENTTLYRSGLHARSLDYSPRRDRDRVRALHAAIAHDIPDGWRVCGENVWATHSIRYSGLRSFFFVFSIWTDDGALSWDDTLEWSALLGLEVVPVLFRGLWDEQKVRALYQSTHEGNECEGYVARVSRAFPPAQFRTHVGKYVRAGHVRTQAHWTRRIEPNSLAEPR